MKLFLTVFLATVTSAHAADTGYNCFGATLRKLGYLTESRYVSPSEFLRVLQSPGLCTLVSKPSEAEIQSATGNARRIVGLVASANGAMPEHSFVAQAGGLAFEKADNLPTSRERTVRMESMLKERGAQGPCPRKATCHKFFSCRLPTALKSPEQSALKRIFRDEAPKSRKEFRGPHPSEGLEGDYE